MIFLYDTVLWLYRQWLNTIKFPRNIHTLRHTYYYNATYIRTLLHLYIATYVHWVHCYIHLHTHIYTYIAVYIHDIVLLHTYIATGLCSKMFSKTFWYVSVTSNCDTIYTTLLLHSHLTNQIQALLHKVD